MATHRRVKSSRGTALMEFGIVMVILIPLFFGMVLTGITTTFGMQAMQLNRDVGHMYSLGTDFATASSRAQAQSLSQNMDLSANGSGVIILTLIKLVYQADCDAQALPTCPNLGQYVITQRLTLGNPAAHSSAFGNPSSTYMNAQGNISPANYLTQSALIATNGSNTPAVPAGNSVYVSESYFALPSLQYLNQFGIAINGVYSTSYF